MVEKAKLKFLKEEIGSPTKTALKNKWVELANAEAETFADTCEDCSLASKKYLGSPPNSVAGILWRNRCIILSDMRASKDLVSTEISTIFRHYKEAPENTIAKSILKIRWAELSLIKLGEAGDKLIKIRRLTETDKNYY